MQVDNGEDKTGENENDDEQNERRRHSQNDTRIEFGLGHRVFAEAAREIFRTLAHDLVVRCEAARSTIFAFAFVWLCQWVFKGSAALAVESDARPVAIGTRALVSTRNEQTLVTTVVA